MKLVYRLSFEDFFTGLVGDAVDELSSSPLKSEAPGYNALAAFTKAESIWGPPSPTSWLPDAIDANVYTMFTPGRVGP